MEWSEQTDTKGNVVNRRYMEWGEQPVNVLSGVKTVRVGSRVNRQCREWRIGVEY